VPVEMARFQAALMESFHLVKGCAREHVLLYLVPVFFIAGAVAAFVSQATVMKYLGPELKIKNGELERWKESQKLIIQSKL